jgi:hypothetical protein
MSQQVATERRDGVEIRAGFVRLAGDLVRNRLLNQRLVRIEQTAMLRIQASSKQRQRSRG